MLLLPLIPLITYLKLKKIKDQKTRHFTSKQVILQGNSFGKGYGH